MFTDRFHPHAEHRAAWVEERAWLPKRRIEEMVAPDALFRGVVERIEHIQPLLDALPAANVDK